MATFVQLTNDARLVRLFACGMKIGFPSRNELRSKVLLGRVRDELASPFDRSAELGRLTCVTESERPKLPWIGSVYLEGWSTSGKCPENFSNDRTSKLLVLCVHKPLTLNCLLCFGTRLRLCVPDCRGPSGYSSSPAWAPSAPLRNPFDAPVVIPFVKKENNIEWWTR